MEFITSLDHPTFQTLQRPLLYRGLLQKVAEIALTITRRVQAIAKESQHAIMQLLKSA